MSESTVMVPDLAAWLLLVVLAVVLLLGFTFLALVLHLSRRHRMEGSSLIAKRSARVVPEPQRFDPAFSDLPPRWLAIRSTKLDVVQSALGISNPTPCPLGDGLRGSGHYNLFISPPIRGWIIVTGNDLPDPAHDVDRCFIWLRDLSNKIGEVQFFSQHRALDHHAWVRLLTGEVFRAYAWAGETIWNQGALTKAELDLGLVCQPYGAPDSRTFSPNEERDDNTEKVPRLAARWSLDPATIDRNQNWPRHGIAGELNPF